MGENAGRFFLTQFIESLGYLKEMKVAHRDLKLENIMIDDKMNTKLADFGTGCYNDANSEQNIDELNQNIGTPTYCAPDVTAGKTYNGAQADIFSIGVVIFIIVQGTFPFKEAKSTDKYYDCLLTDQPKYFKSIGAAGLSANFKDLVVKCFAPEGKNRPTIEELCNHPWMKKENFDYEAVREKLLADFKKA